MINREKHEKSQKVPSIGNFSIRFSNHWNNFFQALETVPQASRLLFQPLEILIRRLRRWAQIFQPLELFFPDIGKLSIRFSNHHVAPEFRRRRMELFGPCFSTRDAVESAFGIPRKKRSGKTACIRRRRLAQPVSK